MSQLTTAVCRVPPELWRIILGHLPLHKRRRRQYPQKDYDIYGNYIGAYKLDHHAVLDCMLVCRLWHDVFIHIAYRKVWVHVDTPFERLFLTVNNYCATLVQEFYMGHDFYLDTTSIDAIWNGFPNLLLLDLGHMRWSPSREVSIHPITRLAHLVKDQPRRLLQVAYRPYVPHFQAKMTDPRADADSMIDPMHSPADVPKLWLHHSLELGSIWDPASFSLADLEDLDYTLKELLQLRRCGFMTRVETIAFYSIHHLCIDGCPQWLQEFNGYKRPEWEEPPLQPGWGLVTQFTYRSGTNDWTVSTTYQLVGDAPSFTDHLEATWLMRVNDQRRAHPAYGQL